MGHLLEGAACPRVQILCLLNCERRRCFAATTNSRPPPTRRGFCGPSNARPPVMVSVPGCSRLARYGQHQGIEPFSTAPLLPQQCPGFSCCIVGVRVYRRNPVPRSLYRPIDRTEAAPSVHESGPEGSRGPFAETELVKPPDRGRSFRLREQA